MGTVNGQTLTERQEGYTLSTVWPKGEPNTAFAQYFIGNSNEWLEPVTDEVYPK